MLLTSPEEQAEESKETSSNPILHFSKTHSILSAAAYCLCLALAQLYASTPALIPIILLARLCLLFPLLIPAQYYPSLASIPAKIPQDRATGDEVQRVILKTALIMTCMKAYQAVQEGFGPEEITVALWGHPAVLALGGDVFLCAVAFTAWNWCGPRVMRPAASGSAAAAAAKTKTKTAATGTTGKENRKEARKEAKAARKSGGAASTGRR